MDRFYMKMNSFKNLVGFEKSEEEYFFAWQKDVETIQEAYDFLDVWVEDLGLPIQEKLISCWDQAYRCIGLSTATEDLLISPKYPSPSAYCTVAYPFWNGAAR